MTLTGVVDALEQAHRRLHPAGKMLVLIPAAYRPWVKVGSRTLGRIDERSFRPALDIVDRGLQRVIDTGLFRSLAVHQLDVIDQADDGPDVFSYAPRDWHFGARLRDALMRVRRPVAVHKRSVLRVLTPRV